METGVLLTPTGKAKSFLLGCTMTGETENGYQFQIFSSGPII